MAILFGSIACGTIARHHVWVAQALASRRFSRPSPTEVDVVPLINGSGDNHAPLKLSGYVIAESRIHVSAKVHGTVIELPIEPGSRVRKGDLLVRIESLPFEADLKSARATLKITEARWRELQQGSRVEEIEQLRAGLEQAQSRCDLGRKELRRSERLHDTISEAEFDKVNASVREAEALVKQLKFAVQMAENGTRAEQLTAAAAEVERAKALLEKSQYLCDCTRVVSELDGVVLERCIELGESLRIDPVGGSTTLCVVANLDHLLAEVEVPEGDLPRAAIGQRCRVAAEATPNNSYEARVENRSPEVNRQRGVVPLKAKILNPDGNLMPGMSCTVTFSPQPTSPGDLVQVPRQALVNEQDCPSVFVLEDGRAQRRTVKLGREYDQNIEIASGLRVGDRVLLPLQPR